MLKLNMLPCCLSCRLKNEAFYCYTINESNLGMGCCSYVTWTIGHPSKNHGLWSIFALNFWLSLTYLYIKMSIINVECYKQNFSCTRQESVKCIRSQSQIWLFFPNYHKEFPIGGGNKGEENCSGHVKLLRHSYLHNTGKEMNSAVHVFSFRQNFYIT